MGAGKREITDEQRQEIKDAFTLFDEDKDGRLDYHECKVLFETHNRFLSASTTETTAASLQSVISLSSVCLNRKSP